MYDSYSSHFVRALRAHTWAFSPTRAISPTPVRNSSLKQKVLAFVYAPPVRSVRPVLC